jgi:simple sugar transport system ATP-binding protein
VTSNAEETRPEAHDRGDAIRVEHIAKSYGPVVALGDVSLRLGKGEVLGLIGDNGAGKSTLIKILTGVHQPDSGTIFVDGQEVVLRSVIHARSLGIDAVYQDLALVPELPVYQNMFLRRELTWSFLRLRVVNRGEMRRRARSYLEDIGVGIPSVDTKVEVLSGGQRQAIAISRSTHFDAKVLLLDEPLAAMGAREGKLILDLIKRFKEKRDVSIILIAHNYLHVLEVCDRVNLLRNGRIVLDKVNAETSADELMSIVATEYRGA